MNEISIDKLSEYSDKAIGMGIDYMPKLIGALLVLFIGFKIASLIARGLEKVFEARKIDPTIEKFLSSLVKNILKALIVIAAVGILGVETSSFVAIFAALGIAIGMALSGTLGHFASGVMILLFKPYKVGDLIETAGHFGTVKEVQIFNTILTTLDAKTIIIPNSSAIGGSIVNFSMEDKKRVDLEIGVSYDEDLDKVKKVLQKIADAEDKVIHEDGITIGVKELGDNAVILVFRTWVKTSDYWDMYFGLTESVKKTFDKEKISFPFPQRDVHLYNKN